MQGSAEGLDDGYDIVASADTVGKDSCLIEDFAEANMYLGSMPITESTI